MGIFFLLGGSLSDLTIPLFVGRTIDLLTNEEYDNIGPLCIYMLVIILVSTFSRIIVDPIEALIKLITRYLGFWSLCWPSCSYLQRSE